MQTNEIMPRESFAQTVAYRIAFTRQDAGLTQEQLSVLVGCGYRANISHLECGVQVPNAYTLYKIAQALGVTMESLCEPL